MTLLWLWLVALFTADLQARAGFGWWVWAVYGVAALLGLGELGLGIARREAAAEEARALRRALEDLRGTVTGGNHETIHRDVSGR